MKVFKVITLAALLAGTSVSASAQVYRRAQRMARFTLHADSIVRNFQKKLSSFEFAVEDDSADVALTPYIYRMGDPSTFYSKSLKDEFSLNWKQANADDAQLASSNGMTYRAGINKMIDKALVGAYISNPNNFTHYDSQFENEEVMKEADVTKNDKAVESILQSAPVISDVTQVIEDESKVDIVAEKPNFWKKSGKFTTQFTQSYYSGNWYKGGSNNVNLLSTLLLEANYNDQNKVQWDNKADFRLGFVSTPNDEIRKFMTNNDRLYLASKLGVKATKAWYYTIQAEVQSQFMPGYRSNKSYVYSRFLSPLDVFVSIGMDFKPTLKKGTLSVALLPLSYKMRYINDKEKDIFDDKGNNTYPIHQNSAMMKEGVPITTKHDFGSKIEANYKLELVKNLEWRSRFYYYTTYKYAESEWENNFSFKFNKYLSTELNCLWRFDDNRDPSTKDDKLGYFQFKEYFTFGLAYSF